MTYSKYFIERVYLIALSSIVVVTLTVSFKLALGSADGLFHASTLLFRHVRYLYSFNSFHTEAKNLSIEPQLQL